MYFFIIFVSGDITQKGYEKKRARLLTPYVAQQQPQGELDLTYLEIKRNIAANTVAWTNRIKKWFVIIEVPSLAMTDFVLNCYCPLFMFYYLNFIDLSYETSDYRGTQ